ncbi:PREDICTED: astacin-like metalloendopeptidase isoform X1 [Crocodylus porosus]|uniref:astacin-like metalloendopeptidase isoform X1 n=1 Tax=Crocodylus porosus TaxID=8502 RepID=UPI00093BA153|nr:PREDICTED: astacin-like metalloendopeptidase isoform X1 [Crocodylus porosus]
MNLILLSALLTVLHSFVVGKPVQVATRNNEADTILYESDIVLRRQKRSAMNCDCFWPKSQDGLVKIPVNVSSDFSVTERAWIVEAMQEFNTLTCVQFVNRTTESSYIKVVPGKNCWSFFGKIGGAQTVALMKNGCMSKGAIQHELNHALGFIHEQSRSDRDNYVRIMWEYIMAGEQENFGKVNSNNLGLPYDYFSVMHYGAYAFSNTSGKATIVPIPDPSVPIGQRYGLSNLDVAKINKIYNCNRCSSVLPNANGTFSSANYPSPYPDNSNCLWLIRIPQNKVFLQFQEFSLQSSPHCALDYIRIYDGSSRNAQILLDKYCGVAPLPALVASGHMMLIEFVSDMAIAGTGFTASYSHVKCGGTFTNAYGVITSPNYPNKYPKNQDCFWIVGAPPGYQIFLKVVFFELEDIDECRYDYLVIHNGSRPTSPAVGPYCGTMKIPEFTSTENFVLVEFHSDIVWVFHGFMINYTFVMPS